MVDVDLPISMQLHDWPPNKLEKVIFHWMKKKYRHSKNRLEFTLNKFGSGSVYLLNEQSLNRIFINSIWLVQACITLKFSIV
jgi:NAD kinase